MKKILLIPILLSLCSCSLNTVSTEETTEQQQVDTLFSEYMETYQSTLDNESFPEIPTLYIKTDSEIFTETQISDFENKTFDDILKLISDSLNTSINATITENDTNIIVDFKDLPDTSVEIKVLDSIANTLHKNYKKDIIFRLKGQEYNSSALYFGIDEDYPII